MELANQNDLGSLIESNTAIKKYKKFKWYHIIIIFKILLKKI